MHHISRLLVFSTLALLAAPLPAQDSCMSGQQLVPYFGWDGTECTNCTIRGSYIEYIKEPFITHIRKDGPAAGRLREHDMILAVDGLAITTPEAWHRMRDAKPGEMVRFRVRNDGETREETVRAAGRCVPAPSKPKVIVLRRRSASI